MEQPSRERNGRQTRDDRPESNAPDDAAAVFRGGEEPTAPSDRVTFVLVPRRPVLFHHPMQSSASGHCHMTSLIISSMRNAGFLVRAVADEQKSASHVRDWHEA
jgi:hypothetical protein